jgi:phosphoserine phosphatase RsbU/P
MADPNLEQIVHDIQEENRNLKKSVEELSILNDIAAAISSTQSLEQIESVIIRKCLKHIKAEEGIIMLLSEMNPDRPFETIYRKENSHIDSLPHKIDVQIMGWIFKHKSSLLINNFFDNPFITFSGNEHLSVKTLLCAPMMIKSKLTGFLALFNKLDDSGFTENDRRFLTLCAMQSAQVIENTRLYGIENILKKINEEMVLAKEIQNNLLPKTFPHIEGYRIAGKSIPAREVGGDHFDFVTISEKRTALFLGDITGKGIPAALLMANLQGILRAQSVITDNCAECLNQSNLLLYNNSDSDKFATLFYSILDTSTHTLFYSSAGHENPFLISADKEILRLGTDDIVLGIVPDYRYSEKKLSVMPGDLIIICSDGIKEAENKEEEQFGELRLVETIRKNILLPPEPLIDKIFQAVDKFADHSSISDDKTLVILKREY